MVVIALAASPLAVVVGTSGAAAAVAVPGEGKPAGGLDVALVAVPAQVPVGAEQSFTVRAVPETAFSSLRVAVGTSGPLAVRSAATTTIDAPKPGKAANVPVHFAVTGAGAGSFTAAVTALDARGAAVMTRSRTFWADGDGRTAYLSASGPLDAATRSLAGRQGQLGADEFARQSDALLGGGASETTTVGVRPQAQALQAEPGPVVNLAGGSITINGQIRYNDRNGNPHPVRLAPVEIRDNEGGGNSDLVTTVNTDANGNYTATVNNDDGAGGGIGRDIFIRVLARSEGFDIKPPAGTTHRIDSGLQADVPDGSNLTINLTANNTADNNTAFGVHDALVTTIGYVKGLLGASPAAIDIIFPTGEDTSKYTGTAIHILQLDRFDWDVTTHEYGHYFMDFENIEDNPGGSHSSNDNLAEAKGKDVGTRLAWGEGYPTYFGTMLQQKMGVAAFGIPSAGDTFYTDTEDSTLNYDLEASPNIGLGEDNELAVSRVLWDLYDTPADNGDMRGIARGDVAIHNALKPAGPVRLSAAYTALVNGLSASALADVGCIATQQGVAPRITAPANESVSVASQPPTVTWAAQGGGPSFRNNAFIVQFYNSNFSSLLLATAEQSGTTFTPSAAQWSTIAAGSGNVVNVVIRGRQTSSPATGPYTSCNIRINTKATPTISTQASPGNLLGAPVRDVATLSNGFNPTGNVTFRLFSNNTCTTQVFTAASALSGLTATSPWFTPTAAGTYYWTAQYSGDGNNHSVLSPCLAPNESVVIAPFVAPPFTSTITGDTPGAVTINAGESVLVRNARVNGTITVNPGGALTFENSYGRQGIVANNPTFFSLCGGDVAAKPSTGQAISVTNAGVPIRIGDPAVGCAGVRIAGTVNLATNLAVMFGGNTAGRAVTVTNNGPGNTIIKANGIYTSLSCTGNNPTPTNAGQPNTGPGVKSGQCSAL